MQAQSLPLRTESIGSRNRQAVCWGARRTASIALGPRASDLPVTKLVLGPAEGLVSFELVQLIRGGSGEGRDVVHSRRVADSKGIERGVWVGVIVSVKVHVVRRAEMGQTMRPVVVVEVALHGISSVADLQSERLTSGVCLLLLVPPFSLAEGK